MDEHWLLPEGTIKMQHSIRTRFLPAALGLLAMSIALGGCNSGSSISDKKIEYIDLNRAVSLYEEQLDGNNADALFLDIRRPERFAEGHIPGARNFRARDIDTRYGTDPSLEKYDNLIVYGENAGSAGARAMSKRLLQAGYNSMLKKRIKLYLGGWDEWYATGLDIEKSESQSSDAEGEQ